MQNTIVKERQNSLEHREIRKASFVSTSEQHKERFKYVSKFIKNIKRSLALNDLKRKKNSFFQGMSLKTQKIDQKKILKDFFTWFIEAAVEGTAINFALNQLFGLAFNPGMILACGIAQKQILSFYWRLRNNGEPK